MMSSPRVTARSSAKHDAERRMVRRRDREHQQRAQWDDRADYYRSWTKANDKFGEWTSPRYYEHSNRTIEEAKREREKSENLERRRAKLKKLLDEENRTYEIELMVRKGKTETTGMRHSTETLRDVHLGVKLAEEDRRRHRAELALYQQWRDENPTVREHERRRTARDLKLTWLDRQVEKRAEKERAEEECRQILAERERRMEEGRREEERLRRETAEKNEELRRELEKQVEALKLRQSESEMLREAEDREAHRLSELEALEERRRTEEKRRRDQEIALENLKLHKLKLKRRAADVAENLERDRALIGELLESEALQRIEDKMKRDELKTAAAEFLRLARDQQDLERRRRQHFDFVFDSEAAAVYERQLEVWRVEEEARDALARDVVDAVRRQIDEKAAENRERQRALLEKRRDALRLVEGYDEQMRRNREEERTKRETWRRALEAQVEEKRAENAAAKARERDELDSELEAAGREEERLRREIADLQRRRGPVRHAKSRILP